MTKSLLLNRYILLILMMGSVFCDCRTQNLIQNGSFENISPPANWNNWSGEFVTFSQTPSHRVLFDWDEFNSSDLFTASCTNTFSGVPVNSKGYSQAKNGINYAGFMLFGNGLTNNGKEYIYQQLSSSLQAGKNYCLNFFVSRADRKEFSIENIGAYFSVNVQSTGSIGYINKTPQVFNQNGVITDTTGWTLIQGCFIADGGEQFITIGNFSSDTNTNYIYSGTNNPIPSSPAFAYYYIDDIQLWDALTTDIESLDGNKFNVYPNPANDVLNFEFTGESHNRQVLLYDAIGNCIITKDASSDKLTLVTDKLPGGVYFYAILLNGKTIKNDKIIVIK